MGALRLQPLCSETLSSAPHPPGGAWAKPLPPVSQPGPGGAWQEEESGRQAGPGPTHTLPLLVPGSASPARPPPSLPPGLHLPAPSSQGSLENQEPEDQARAWVSFGHGSLPPGRALGWEVGSPVPALLPVWRGKLALGGASLGP